MLGHVYILRALCRLCHVRLICIQGFGNCWEKSHIRTLCVWLGKFYASYQLFMFYESCKSDRTGKINQELYCRKQNFRRLPLYISFSSHRDADYGGAVARFVPMMTFDDDESSADSGNFIYLWYFSIKTAMRARVSCGCIVECRKPNANAGVLVGVCALDQIKCIYTNVINLLKTDGISNFDSVSLSAHCTVGPFQQIQIFMSLPGSLI